MKVDQLHLPRILQFVRVVERGSISKAAAELRLTQPALTRNIKKLEQSFGVPLIDRSNRGVTPTVYGELLIQRAQSIRANLQQVLADIDSIAGNKGGVIRVGATPFATSRILSVAAPAFQLEHSDVRIRAVESTRTVLLAQLRSGDLDLVITTIGEGPETDLTEQTLYADQTSLWASSSHPLARKKNLSLSLLADECWILPLYESGYRAFIEGELKNAGVAIRGPVIESSSLQLVRSLVVHGGRIAALPGPMLAPEIAIGAVVPLRGQWTFPPRMHGLYQRAVVSQTSALRALIRNIQKASKELSASYKEKV